MTDVEQGTVRGDRKVRTGRVISDKMDKTVVVQVANRRSHPLYKKVMQRRENFKAHDETNECRIGDLVRIMETRPISKDKRWRVVEVVEKAR
jgi:small subunit ribosomal protein S17